jgi:hypothetical protein
MEYLMVIAVIATIVFMVRNFSNNNAVAPRSQVDTAKNSTRIKLTNEQISALSCANYDKPIYGETPKHRSAQMPNGARCFDLRTVQSLEKRGYLSSDSKGGYLMTDEGMNALRNS